ncbi:2188_t:CDS:2 [Funneliformis mosseae]|uniref:2188_t:CDS:1 n=1 Tax=Funneliformis mosseae TaxID=27381 RepID=A0A9N9G1K7_FUNMO|nr:2188_t:CDS:2 [Funneliformis mosseae]
MILWEISATLTQLSLEEKENPILGTSYDHIMLYSGENKITNLDHVFLMGYLNYSGFGTVLDAGKAYNYFKQVSSSHPVSQYYLGKYYENGLGVTTNKLLANALNNIENDDDFEKLKSDVWGNIHELYDHVFAYKILVGGQIFIKDFNLASSIQKDVLKLYLIWAYNSAKDDENSFNNNSFGLNFLPRIETSNGVNLDTPKKSSNWLNSLYQENIIDIISYDKLVSITQLKNGKLDENYENFDERYLGIANFEKKVEFGKVDQWIKEFRIFQGLVIQSHKVESSKKIAMNIIQVPQVNSVGNFYFEMINPTTKCEQYEVLINKNHLEPSFEFCNAIEKALNEMKPLNALQNIYLKLPILESLNSYFKKCKLSHFITQTGNILEKDSLYNWISNANHNGLEIVEYDKLISLYDILGSEQKKKIDIVTNNNNQDIMTGITDLKDLDNENTEHYKRMFIEPSLDD